MKSLISSIILFIATSIGLTSPTPDTSAITVSTSPHSPQTIQQSVVQKTTTIQKTTKTPRKTLASVPKTIPTRKPVETNIISIKPTPTPVPTSTFDQLNASLRSAVVNILCTTQSTGALSPLTASGIIISDSGVILTNAHVAQYFLLKNFDNHKDFVQCVIRTGNPAYTTYTADLVYISPAWINAHKQDIIATDPKGTGEHDFALLRITGRTDGSPLPSYFSFIPLNTGQTELRTPTLLMSYPAGFLGGQSILQGLYQSSAVTSVSDRFTFGSNTSDLISIGGTILSQKGSSGGAAVDSQGQLIGIITTSSEEGSTGSRDLRAITSSYIESDLQSESQTSISSIIKNSLQFGIDFNTKIAPGLTQALTDAVLKRKQ